MLIPRLLSRTLCFKLLWHDYKFSTKILPFISFRRELTDLKVFLSDARTQDHSRNFDVKQLVVLLVVCVVLCELEKLSIQVATLIDGAFERNPELDRGHR